MKTGNSNRKLCEHICKNMNFFLFNLQWVFLCMLSVCCHLIVCGVCSEKVEMFLKNISEQFILKCLVVSDIKRV